MQATKEPPLFGPTLVRRRVVRDVDFSPAKPGASAIETVSYSLGEFPWVPDLEVFEQDGHLTIHVDLPALTLEDVSVTVTDGRVKIAGERRRQATLTRKDLHVPERIYGRFNRTLRLPEGFDADAASWAFENGVLQITFPLLEKNAAEPAA